MEIKIDTRYPSITDLRNKAQKKIPKFAFEYLDGGCNEDVNLRRNTSELREVQLQPQYLKNFNGSSLKTTLFGIEYDAPFGIAPVGLQGLMWPNSPEILAKAAFNHNIPFILSTVTTTSIERTSELTEGKSWFQLYHPTENRRVTIREMARLQGYPDDYIFLGSKSEQSRQVGNSVPVGLGKAVAKSIYNFLKEI